jgi:hypothetical protein
MGKRHASGEMKKISEQLKGLVIAELVQPDDGTVTIHFTNKTTLVIRRSGSGFSAVIGGGRSQPSKGRDPLAPTGRQQEYLDFIKKYMHRFGVAPAETDIQRHFLVSAPSVNQMIRTLERRGFIVRDRDWFGQTQPRSIRVVWDP